MAMVWEYENPDYDNYFGAHHVSIMNALDIKVCVRIAKRFIQWPSSLPKYGEIDYPGPPY
jgi:hypothetical protein